MPRKRRGDPVNRFALLAESCSLDAGQVADLIGKPLATARNYINGRRDAPLEDIAKLESVCLELEAGARALEGQKPHGLMHKGIQRRLVEKELREKEGA